MATITITKENFWQKISLIYKKVYSAWKIKINIDERENWDEFSIKNKKAWLESKKDLDNWNTLSLEKLKAKYM